MENIFELVITKLLEVGFYDFLIFMIAMALFYGLLKKIKFFEGSSLVNAVLAFSIAFLIFGFPVIMNFSLVLPFVTFFTQTFVFILVFLIAMLVATFFYPDLPKFLAETFTSRSMISISIVIGLALAIVSGTISILWATPPLETVNNPAPPFDTTIVATSGVLFVVFLIVAGSIALRGGG